MWKNHFKIAWRNLVKNKVFTLSNVVGLSMAFAVALLLTMAVLDVLSYDTFHKNGDHIYQVYSQVQTSKGPNAGTNFAMPMAPALKEDVPGLAHVARSLSSGVMATVGDKDFDLDTQYVDPDYFSIFTFPLLNGSTGNPFHGSNSVALTEKAAQKLFGSVDVVGKVLNLNMGEKEIPFTIGSILQNVPENSSDNFEIVIPFEENPDYAINKDKWNSSNHEVFLQLADGVTPEQFEINTRAFVDLRYKEGIERNKRDGALPDANGAYIQLKLLPVKDRHFVSYANGVAEVQKGFVYLVLAIALLIIFIACANYVNMSIALSERRLKEIGMYKTLGAVKKQLFIQFWVESLIIFFTAIVLGYLGAWLLLHPFQELFQTKATLNILLQPWILLILALVLFGITFISGGYPALLMSKLNILRALKGKWDVGGNRLRNTLIVVQFTIAIILITGTLVLQGQLHFLRNKDLGFDKEQVVSVPLTTKLDPYRAVALLRDELSGNPQILSVSAASANLGMGKDGGRTRSMIGLDYKEHGVTTNVLNVDFDYVKTLGFQLLEGRSFDRKMATDSIGLVINEAMAKELGEKDPLEARLEISDGVFYPVIGMVKDYNFDRLDRAVEPMTLMMNKDWGFTYAFVKVAPGNVATAFDAIKEAWGHVDPNATFQGSFLDENVDRTFNREKTMATIITSGCVLGIVLSCIGLFAISLLVVGQRTKEIGIRKVIGANVLSITFLLTKDFLKLVGVAFIIATPVSWYLLQQWLQGYAYHVSLSPLFFVGAGMLSVAVALLTIGTKTLAAARANPAKSLKTE